jgi:kumamolisin
MQLNPYFRPRATTGDVIFTVKQLCSIYDFPTPSTAKVCVGIVSFGGGMHGNISSSGVLTNGDVQKYWAYQGIPSSQMPKVIVKFIGVRNNTSDSNSTTENTLDVAVLGTCCPSSNLTILLFICPSTYTLTQAVSITLAGTGKNIPSIISISWGAPELLYYPTDPITGLPDTSLPPNDEDLSNLNTLLMAATARGVNICVAAGDNGSGNGLQVLSTDFPASCPYTISVGGTTLRSPNLKYDASTSETVWNDGVMGGVLYSTGGGISKYFNKLPWQTYDPTYRCVPDVAMDADPSTGIYLYVKNQLITGIGGTSMSAPMVAGLLACINPTVFVAPLLYSNPQCFFPITEGNNYGTNMFNLYTAGPGYDCCTGLGSISGLKLKQALFTIQSSTTTISVGQSLQLSIPILNIPVTWSTSNTRIATVSSQGIVTGRTPGTISISAKSGKVTTSISITITQVSITVPSLSIVVGSQIIFQPHIVPIVPFLLRLSNSNVSYSNGMLKALKVGTTLITVNVSSTLVSNVVTVVPMVKLNRLGR